ncbi:MAG: polyprenol monophosphomannose synthase [Deltaproteobacteria bacterium]|nr:polyprenol monophosphomannose synthase [Deltaproteobacteria bacterium]
MGRVLIVTPTYNERENLPGFCDLVRASMPDAHVLVVDDASPDGTGELADDLHRQHPDRVSVLHRGAKLGLGSAYLAAFRKALSDGWDVVVQMDADLSHDPSAVPALLAAIEDGADVAVGSRYVRGGAIEGWGAGRHVISRGGSLYSRAILATGVHDMTSGFKAIRSEVLASIALDSIRSEGYSFQIELTYRALRRGFRVVEVPIVFVDRRAGQSKLSGRVFAEAVGMPWKLRFDALRGRL